MRLTFDRNICAEPFFRAKAVVEMKKPVRVFAGFVVLELKFTTRFPNWFQQLVRRFNLMQFSSAKYCEGVELLGSHRFLDEYPACAWPSEPEFRTAPAESAPQSAGRMGEPAL